jgi:hypothetical protein
MRKIIGKTVLTMGYISSLYVGGWIMFIKPIIQTCTAFDSNVLTGEMILFTILKILLAGTVATVIAWIATLLKILIENDY